MGSQLESFELGCRVSCFGSADSRSKEFQRTTRLRGFPALRVGSQTRGGAQEITEALIGQRVFGRPSTYNPGDDSIVRTEARNLRQRLERYFAGEGAVEPILLEIPKGGYVPVFRPRHAVSEVEVKRAAPGSGSGSGWLWRPAFWRRWERVGGFFGATAHRRETVSAAAVVRPAGRSNWSLQTPGW